uniref:pancreatic elastase n=1 Tax=Neogobius melanostomus TaxID=47308 RepID=A0A8C6SBW4_9GOBI
MERKTNLFLFVCVAVLAELEPQPMYLEDTVEKRVVGGQVAKPNSWPWQISLQYRSGFNYYHICGGTLIRAGWVMTAAHLYLTIIKRTPCACVLSARTWRIVLGDHDISNHEGSEQYMSVSNVYIHPDWDRNRPSAGNDIALLRLSSEATLNNKVKLGALPPLDGSCPTTTTATSPSAKLKQAYLPVVNHNTCSSSGWWGSTVKTNMVCAGGGNESGCQGDSGGPLNCSVGGRWVVHGVASFVSSSGCNAYRRPTVFTRASAFISWMNSHEGRKIHLA